MLGIYIRKLVYFRMLLYNIGGVLSISYFVYVLVLVNGTKLWIITFQIPLLEIERVISCNIC